MTMRGTTVAGAGAKEGRMRRIIMSLWRDFTHAFSGWSGIVLAALLGVVLGVGLFTVQYSGACSMVCVSPCGRTDTDDCY